MMVRRTLGFEEVNTLVDYQDYIYAVLLTRSRYATFD